MGSIAASSIASKRTSDEDIVDETGTAMKNERGQYHHNQKGQLDLVYINTHIWQLIKKRITLNHAGKFCKSGT